MSDRAAVGRIGTRPSVRQLSLAVVAAAAFAFEGTLVVLKPAIGIAVVAAIGLMAGLAALRDASYSVAWLAGVVVLAGFVDSPRHAQLGSITGLGLLTIVFAVATLPFWITPALLVRRSVPLAWLLLVPWICATALINPPTAGGLQNILVFVAFISAIAIAASTTRMQGNTETIDRFFVIASSVAIVLYGTGVLIEGFESNLLIEPRAFALFAVVALAWSLAGFRLQRRWGWRSAALILLIGVSLSRTALVVSLLLVGLSWLRPTSISGWVKSICAVAVAVGCVLVAVQKIQPLHDRFFSGDVVAVGGSGLAVNVMGRADIWSHTWRSYTTSPVLGQGAGSSGQVTVEATGGEVEHPHQDYLRILHDYGAIGFVLWIVGYVAMLVGTSRRAFTARMTEDDDRRVHLAAFLGLVALGFAMLTDNPIIYVFALAPLGVLIGASTGLASARSRERGSDRLETTDSGLASGAHHPRRGDAAGVRRFSTTGRPSGQVA